MTAEIRVLSGARAGFVLRLSEDTLVGRTDDSGLRFDPQSDREVSSRHATIGVDADGWFIRDERSRNGTFLNGRRVDWARLADGDRIVFGGDGPEIEFRIAQAAGDATAASRPPAQSDAQDLAAQNVWLKRAVLLLFLALFGSVLLTLWSGRQRRSEWARERSALLSRVDSVLDVGDATVQELTEDRANLADALRQSRIEIQRVRSALENSQGNSAAETTELRGQLQSALASLGQQRLAAALDFDAVERAARRAVATVWVDTGDEGPVTGTAFAVDADGTLITARHILEDESGLIRPRAIAVKFADSDQVWRARVVGVSDVADLAVLKAIGSGVEGAVFAAPPFNMRPDTLGPGAPVAWIGFPGPQDSSPGVVADPQMRVGVIVEVAAGDIEVQGYGDVGDSGSPLLDGNGLVVAVVYGGSNADGLLYAVPAIEAVRLLNAVR